jgi:hypothetical protein
MSDQDKAYEQVASRANLLKALLKLNEDNLVKKLQSMSVDVYINRYGSIVWEGNEIDYYALLGEVESLVEDLPQEEVEQFSKQ